MKDPEVLPQQQRENAEPFERHRPVPWPLLAGTVLMMALGSAYIVITSPDEPASWGDGRVAAELRGAPPAGAASSTHSTADGAAVFAARCVACHQATGLGLPGAFPPLAGSEWVLGKDTMLAAIVLHGVSGAINVKGAAFAGAMPSFKQQLQDEEIAAVLTHIRRQWGNSAPAVTAATVAGVRGTTAGRAEPFNGEAELSGLK
jgi:mono/diheme cytochrome c family protein